MPPAKPGKVNVAVLSLALYDSAIELLGTVVPVVWLSKTKSEAERLGATFSLNWISSRCGAVLKAKADPMTCGDVLSPVTGIARANSDVLPEALVEVAEMTR